MRMYSPSLGCSSTCNIPTWKVITSRSRIKKSTRAPHEHSMPKTHSKTYTSIRVEGGRKIWGTMRNTSASAVLTLLNFLLTSQNDNQPPMRKYRTACDDQKWWLGGGFVLFVVRKACWSSQKTSGMWLPHRLPREFSHCRLSRLFTTQKMCCHLDLSSWYNKLGKVGPLNVILFL